MRHWSFRFEPCTNLLADAIRLTGGEKGFVGLSAMQQAEPAA